MVKVVTKGGFDNLVKYLKGVDEKNLSTLLNECGQAGVEALQVATPKKTGLTAASWYYNVVHDKTGWRVEWSNSNIQNGIPIALILQTGHATRSGTYVQGIDYINPALDRVIEEYSIKIGKELL